MNLMRRRTCSNGVRRMLVTGDEDSDKNTRSVLSDYGYVIDDHVRLEYVH